MNQVAITGTVISVKPMRYTPAGLAILEMQLEHASQVQQGCFQRQIQFVLTVFAQDDVALMLADANLGAQLSITGFLAPSRKGSSRLVLHVLQATQLRPDPVVV